MIYFFSAIIVISLVLAFAFRNYRKDEFKKLANKEHPLGFLYPAIARIYDHKIIKLWKILNKKDSRVVKVLMKQLCVGGNIESEIYVYTIKKITSIYSVFLAVCIVGMLLLINSSGDSLITRLTRAEYGKGQTSYQLDVEYDSTHETLEITLDEAELTDEEIHKCFENSFDSIVLELLGDNTSLEQVSQPLNLISSYDNISIQWEISDTTLLDYNGEISEDIAENEFIPIELYATFTISEVSEVYSIPVTLTGETLTARQLLLQNIYDSIDLNNSAYDSDVELPESINGKPLTFKTISDNSAYIIIVLGIIAVIAIALLYDRTLEKKVRLRKEQLAMDFTEIVFKLSLLYEAGLSMFRSWERIVTEYEHNNPGVRRYAYMEMRLTLEQIKSGAPEAQCYGEFGKRCGLQQYVKLGTILEQNLTKGTKGMKSLLRQEAQDSFTERKRLARKKGEKASTKLIFPMLIMLGIVMVIVAVPALMSMNF